jgi:hypothetical protein
MKKPSKGGRPIARRYDRLIKDLDPDTLYRARDLVAHIEIPGWRNRWRKRLHALISRHRPFPDGHIGEARAWFGSTWRDLVTGKLQG